MPADQAKTRLASLLASLPKGATSDLKPEIVAGRLIALLPQAASVNTIASATLRPVVAVPRSRLFVGLGVVALLLVGYFVFAASASHAPDDARRPLTVSSEPAARR